MTAPKSLAIGILPWVAFSLLFTRRKFPCEQIRED
jgi:hypothetical protein